MLNTNIMENLFTPLKSMLVTALCAVLAFFAPIANMIFVIFIIFLMNCVAGILADIIVNRSTFDLKKFVHCLFETFIVFILVTAVYGIGEKLLNVSGAIQCIAAIVYSILYFYSVNILKNCHRMLPSSRVIKFLYYVLSFEIIKKLPYMEKFKENEKNVTDELNKQ